MVQSPPQLQASIIVNGKEILANGAYSRLGRLRAHDEVQLLVSMPEQSCLAFLVNEKSNATAIVAHAGKFSRGIAVREGDKDGVYVGFPTNHVCVATLHDYGQIEITKIGLVSQEGIAYLVQHMSGWQPRLFRHGEDVRCPLFENSWQTLTKVLCEGFAEHKSEFPTLPAGYIPEEEAVPPLPEGTNRGVVVWYEPLRGVGGNGAIRTSRGDVRVQWTETPVREGGLRRLEKDEQVTYRKLADTTGKTSFKKDALDVRLS